MELDGHVDLLLWSCRAESTSIRYLARPVAEIQPLRALHYDLAAAGPLDRLVAPPYDVIDGAQREQLAARSPFNVVQVDLPRGEPDPYARAAELLERWRTDGIVVQDSEPALWALTQTFTGPDGMRRTRHGFFTKVRLTDYGPGLVRPHERTHPAAKEDRLRLMRATRSNLSPIFSLYDDPEGEAWSALEPPTSAEPWGEVADEEGTTHRLWRVADRAAIARVEEALAGRELLIADGHHRYETARTYADGIGGEGEHRFVLMCLVSMSDPGLAIFPTHRLVGGLDDERRRRLDEALRSEFDLSEVAPEGIVPEGGNGGLPTFGLLERDGGARRARLASPDVADRALAGHSDSYRRLDTAVLEKLLLEDALGLTEDDISHQRGLGYARDLAQARELLGAGEYDLAFLLRPTPVEQVQAIAAAGETMPPKSTYFFPKLLSGLLFNPLE
jgi:uncharacterized protein (DUF1015 family)